MFSSTRDVSSPPMPTAKTKRMFFADTTRTMSPAAFLKLTVGVAIGLASLIVVVNITLDIYGLFRSAEGRDLPVYHNERVAKYLMSYRYIPENFNTIVIGTSLSANLNLSSYFDGTDFRVYNASVMGANVSELTPILKNCLDGGVRNVILCVSPYMIKNSGGKEVELNEKLYYSALGSKNLIETYVVAGLRYFNVLPSKYPKGQIDGNGVNRFESFYSGGSVEEKIQLVLRKEGNENFALDEKAVNELKNLFLMLEEKNVQYLVYFHPVPVEFYQGKREQYESFERKVKALLPDESRLINLNDSQYSFFTDNHTNYIDHGHLSPQGARTISKILSDRLQHGAGQYASRVVDNGSSTD